MLGRREEGQGQFFYSFDASTRVLQHNPRQSRHGVAQYRVRKSLGGHAPCIKKPETGAYPEYSASSCKSLQPPFRGKTRKFSRHFKGHFLIGNVQVRILPGQPGGREVPSSTSTSCRKARHGGLLQFGRRSPDSQFPEQRSENAESLWPFIEEFPFLRDSGRRRGSICTGRPSL
jgi:hypothetical protein